MDKLGEQTIWSYFDNQSTARPAKNQKIRAGIGHSVSSYLELAKKVAELQFLNRHHVLLFRGQKADYRTIKNNSMLKPSIFRLEGSKIPREQTLVNRFETLKTAEGLLSEKYENQRLLGFDRLRKQRIIRWAILQHYEVCPTPLLDVTHSLRIAASFATVNNVRDEAFIFAFAVPSVSGAVTASAEAGLQIVRLSSACPPDAVRPHIQEGYLLGEYPEISDFSQHSKYGYYEMDFGRRLIAKFRFNPDMFWSNEHYPPASEAALYPSEEGDPLSTIAAEVAQLISQET
ncbi:MULTISPECIES: FRG domain-containing protein [Rhizobium]|uniref:FRG domain-containing protein n=1 Tax=Rhizobium phaseoli TaxID=396 RepID=UPI0013563A37|nr:FRG domain-containing protein [Rhizobium phaseoli]